MPWWGMMGGRSVSSLYDTDGCLCHAPPPPRHPAPRPHLGLKRSAPNSHFINQEDLSSCEFILLCAGS